MNESVEPANVFRWFEMICAIPHGSGNEGALSRFLMEYARGRGLEARQDAHNNVLIRKPAAPGYESAPGVIIQGHIDMVTEKNEGEPHDFLSDPIVLKAEGDWVRAVGETTLGADNGVGVAMALALLDGDYPAPRIDALFTTGEETGMYGAAALDAGWLDADFLINLDTEEEDVLMCGCAGGAKPTVRLPVSFAAAEGGETYRLTVSGLKGGHSGMEIDKGRGNAIVILARALDALGDMARLCHVQGGTRDNAIPREAEALVLISREHKKAAHAAIARMSDDLTREYRVTDAGAALAMKLAEPAARVMDGRGKASVLAALLGIPNGVLAMSADVPGLVETSNNIGAVRTLDDAVEIITATRSNVSSRLRMVNRQVAAVTAGLGGAYTLRAEYPAWEYVPDSRLRKLCAGLYERHFGKAPKVEAVHAGLECGLFIEKRPGLDAISFGPDITGAHAPGERLSIASARRVWGYLLAILARFAEV